MTQAQLDGAVALALGETIDTVHRLGFCVVAEEPDDLEPEELTLRVTCPFCGKTLPFPGTLRGGALPLGECLACDVYFEIQPEDIFAAALGTA